MLTVTDFDMMRDVQESHQSDLINIQHVFFTYDDYGDVVKSGIVTSGIACGFQFVGSVRNYKGVYIVVDYDADLRLPTDTEIGINDLITLVQKAGVTASGVFELCGYPVYGGSCLHLKLKRKST
jgi:hypothetical protein